MSVTERFAAWRRPDALDAPCRATCMRCHREYTRDPDTTTIATYCWWCDLRVEHTTVVVVLE